MTIAATESTDPRAAPVSSVAPKLAQDYTKTGLASLGCPDLFSLAGKAIIVTGGGRGLGLMIATAALQCQSPHVYCLDIAEMPDPIEWAAAKSTAESMGGRLDYRRVDITEEEAVNKVIADIYNDCEHTVAGYFGSAGMIHQIMALDYPADAFRRVLDVNTTGKSAKIYCEVLT